MEPGIHLVVFSSTDCVHCKDMKADLNLLKTINMWQRMPHNHYIDVSIKSKDEGIGVWLDRGRDWNVSFLPTAVMVEVEIGVGQKGFETFIINEPKKRRALQDVLKNAIPPLQGREKERIANVKRRIIDEGNKKKFSVKVGCSESDLEDQLGPNVEANIFNFLQTKRHCVTLKICCPPVMDTHSLLRALREVFSSDNNSHTIIREHLRLREIDITACDATQQPFRPRGWNY